MTAPVRRTAEPPLGCRSVPVRCRRRLRGFVRIVDGEHWEEVGFPAGSMYGTVHDIRAYYEELACELAEGPIEPWATEEWFCDGTEAGRLILEARRAMRGQGSRSGNLVWPSTGRQTLEVPREVREKCLWSNEYSFELVSVRSEVLIIADAECISVSVMASHQNDSTHRSWLAAGRVSGRQTSSPTARCRKTRENAWSADIRGP